MPLYPPASSTGYAPGGTDVAVADGGTGASTASGARTNLGLVIGTDVRAQGSGDPTSLAASAITVADAGSLLTATEVETALQELALKGIGYSAHGSMGSTETFSALTGWHSGTLDANCTFTLTAAPSGTSSNLLLELLQDGTGGRTITLPASVTNKTALEAAQVTTLSTTSFLALWSRDGGTTWYGAWVGASSAATDATVTFTDITTNNSSTSKHGFLKKLSNVSTEYMSGTGVWSTPAGSGNVATDTIWDAAGDLAVGTGADTAAKLVKGADSTVLTISASTHLPVWQAPSGGGGITRSTLGTTSAGSSFLTTRGTYVKKITLASDGLLSSIHAFVKGDGSYIEMIPVIFTDSSGPTNLLIASWPLVTSGGATLDAMALNTTVRDMSFGVGRWLVAGDYWIGINDYNGTAGLSLAYNSGSGADYQVATAATVKDSSIAAFSSTAHDWCIYADILR